MIISDQQLQIIVEEMENTIHYPINMMDTDGRIIASTDASRIGMIHSSALTVLKDRLEQLPVDGDFDVYGVRPGINLPILMKGVVVGVVGITGNPIEVSVFGTIIKKMTEILITEAYEREQEKISDHARNTWIYRWLFEELTDEDALQQLEFSGHILGIDMTSPRIAVVLEPVTVPDQEGLGGSHEPQFQDGLWLSQLQRSLGQITAQVTASRQSDIWLTVGNQLLWFCSSKRPEVVSALCQQISGIFREKHQILLASGIGSLGRNRNEMLKSYQEARRACYLSLHTRGNAVKQYSESDFTLLLQGLPKNDKTNFVKRIFPGCAESEISQWMLLLQVFFDSNGSIQEAANLLYIHKNTLQYRLNKLKQITGYDPRIYKEGFSLFSALCFYNDVMGDMKL